MFKCWNHRARVYRLETLYRHMKKYFTILILIWERRGTKHVLCITFYGLQVITQFSDILYILMIYIYIWIFIKRYFWSNIYKLNVWFNSIKSIVSIFLFFFIQGAGLYFLIQRHFGVRSWYYNKPRILMYAIITMILRIECILELLQCQIKILSIIVKMYIWPYYLT